MKRTLKMSDLVKLAIKEGSFTDSAFEVGEEGVVEEEFHLHGASTRALISIKDFIETLEVSDNELTYRSDKLWTAWTDIEIFEILIQLMSQLDERTMTDDMKKSLRDIVTLY